MGGTFKAASINGLQQHSDDLLYQLVVNGRDAQRTEFPVLLGDLDIRCPELPEAVLPDEVLAVPFLARPL